MTPCPRCRSTKRVPVPDSLALACETCRAIAIDDEVVGTWGPHVDWPSLGTVPSVTPTRREQLVAWLGIEAGYLRLCARAGFDPGLFDVKSHPPDLRADIARFCRELGGVDEAVGLLFEDGEEGEARTWFRILAGEPAA